MNKLKTKTTWLCLFLCSTFFQLTAQCLEDWVIYMEVGTNAQTWKTATDESNNIYAVFTFSGQASIYPGNGTEEIINSGFADGSSVGIIKFDPDGNIIWTKTLDSPNPTYIGYNIMSKDDGIYLTGSYLEQIYIDDEEVTSVGNTMQGFYLKLDKETGNKIWVQSFQSGQFASVMGIAEAANGNILLSGFFAGDVELPGIGILEGYDINPGFQRHVFLMEVQASTGIVVWYNQSEPYETYEFIYNRAWDIDVAENGDILIAGHYTEQLEIDDQIINSSNSSYLPYIARFAPSGECLWIKGVTDSDNLSTFNTFYAVAEGSDGGVYFSGFVNSEYITFAGEDIQIENDNGAVFGKFDNSNSLSFFKVIGEPSNTDNQGQWATQLIPTDEGVILCSNVYEDPLVNGINLEGNGDMDIGIISFNHEGLLLNHNIIGGGGRETSYDLSRDTENNLISFGYLNSPESIFGSAGLTIDTSDVQNFYLYKQCGVPDISHVEKISENEIHLFPNPTTGLIWMSNYASSSFKRINVFDQLGRQVYEEFLDYTTADIEINLSFLTRGLYTAQFVDQEDNSVFNQIVILK